VAAATSRQAARRALRCAARVSLGGGPRGGRGPVASASAFLFKSARAAEVTALQKEDSPANTQPSATGGIIVRPRGRTRGGAASEILTSRRVWVRHKEGFETTHTSSLPTLHHGAMAKPDHFSPKTVVLENWGFKAPQGGGVELQAGSKPAAPEPVPPLSGRIFLMGKLALGYSWGDIFLRHRRRRN